MTVSTFAIILSLFLGSGVYCQDRTSEAGEAAISDPNQECMPYSYPPVASHISLFPQIWNSAYILPGDTAAQAKWASIEGSIPTNIPVKGTLNGNFTNFTPSYSANDSDCWWTFSGCVTPKLAGLQPDIFNVPEPQTLGYGFDDGPNCSHNAFYDYLNSQNQKATMFYIGSNVIDWPLEAQRGISDGHQVCVHTWSHQYMTAFASPEAFAELYYTIKLVTGVTPTCWRPPFGDVDDRIRAIAQGLGLRTVIWQYDSDDWKSGINGVTPAIIDANYQSLIDMANSGKFSTAGAIMLTHELNNYTMSEAIKFYPQLKQAFKYIVPICVAENITQPYLESDYSMPSFAEYVSGNVSTTKSATPSSASGTNATSGTTKPVNKSNQKTNGASSSRGTSVVLAVVLSAVVLVIA